MWNVRPARDAMTHYRLAMRWESARDAIRLEIRAV
jgi:hypothetical protein